MGKKVKIQYVQGNIAYCGSPLTQNYSELPPKGFLIWDTNKKESRFVQIQNDYEYITISCKTIAEALEHVNNNEYKPTNKIRFIIDEISTFAQNEQLSIECINKYKLKEKPLIISGDIKNDTSQEQIDIGNAYSDIEFQIIYLKKYIEEIGLGEEYKERCVEIHKQCCSEYNFLNNDAKKFSINKLEFSYVGKFGEKNVIDFQKYSGIVGMFSPNRYGKTTIVEALSYAIYGKTIKNISNSDFININSNNATTTIECELQGEIYRITRTLKRSKSNTVKTTVIFEKKIDENNWESLNEEDVKLTNKSIEKYFGTQENILLSSIASQNEMLNFIQSGQAERLKILYGFVGLHFYEHLQKIAKAKYDDVAKEIQILSRTNNSDIYSSLESKKEILTNTIEAKLKEIESLKSKFQEVNNKIEEITSNIEKPKTTINVIELKAELKSVNDNLESNIKQKQKIVSSIKSNNELISKLQSELSELLKNKVYDDIIKELPIIQDSKKEKINIEHKISLKEKEKSQSERSSEIIKKHDWFESNEYCKQCTFLSDAWENKSKIDVLTNEILSFETSLKDIKDKLDKFEFTEEQIKQIQEKTNSLKESKASYEKNLLLLESIEKTIENIQLKKSIIEEKLESNKDIIELIDSNTKLEEQINQLNSMKIYVENSIKNNEEEVWKNKSELAKITGQMQNIEEKLLEIITLENVVKYYKVYIDAVSKNGIPFEIIKSILPNINKEINNVLSQTQDWQIHFVIDDNNLNIEIVDSIQDSVFNRPIEAGSGAENTITSLAIRLALIRMSYLPKSNFFIIDEGFGSLDSDNIMNIKDFLVYLKNYFQIILIISHIPQISDMIDYQWNIELSDDDKKYSYIIA